MRTYVMQSWFVRPVLVIARLEAIPADTLPGLRDLALMSVFFLTGCRGPLASQESRNPSRGAETFP
jgi:hypothetical protein